MSQSDSVVQLTRKNRIGLALAGALGLLDLTNVFMIPAETSDSPGPPTGVLVADAVLGLITVVAVVYTWRTAGRTGSRLVAGSRILSVITALPAFFVTGVGAGVVLLVSVFVIITVVVVALVLSRPAPELATP